MTTQSNNTATRRPIARRALTTALLTAGLVVGLGAGVANAKKPGKGKPGAGGDKIERMCQRLECSAQQKTQLQSILKGKREAHKASRAQLEQLQSQLAAEYRKARPNEATMRRIYSQLDALRDKQRAEMHKTAMQIHAVLTPAQREKVATSIERRGVRALMGGGKGHGERGKNGKNGKNGKRPGGLPSVTG